MNRLLPLLFTALLAAHAEEIASPPTEVEKVTEDLRADLKTRLAKIDTAITAAAKVGTLKPSTEAYFRDCLSQFQTGATGLAETERIYFPPRFESIPAIKPINLAWADLRAEVTRQQRVQDKLATRLVSRGVEEVVAAARTAECAADLAPIHARSPRCAPPSRIRPCRRLQPLSQLRAACQRRKAQLRRLRCP